MNFHEYQTAAGRTLPEQGAQHAFIVFGSNAEFSKLDLLHAALGMAGEAGEVVEHIKKSVFYGKPLDEHKVKEEVGDLLWYVAAPFCRALGCTFEELAAANVAKLRKRYPDKYTDAAALARVDVRGPKPVSNCLRLKTLSPEVLAEIEARYRRCGYTIDEGYFFDPEDHAWFRVEEMWENIPATVTPTAP